MKDFFEDLGKRLGETAESMTVMAGDAIEIQRLKSQIRGLARGSAVDLMELGKTIYDRYKAGEELSEKEKGLCEAIRKREASIREYEAKIAEKKGASECRSCGRMVARDMAFCPYCGAKVASEESTGEAEETAAAKAEEYAEKAGEFAEKAGEAAKDAVEKAAEKTEEFVEKAVKKTEEFAEKAAEKLQNPEKQTDDPAEE